MTQDERSHHEEAAGQNPGSPAQTDTAMSSSSSYVSSPKWRLKPESVDDSRDYCRKTGLGVKIGRAREAA